MEILKPFNSLDHNWKLLIVATTRLGSIHVTHTKRYLTFFQNKKGDGIDDAMVCMIISALVIILSGLWNLAELL